LFSFYYNKEGDGSFTVVAFFFVVQKVTATLPSIIVKKKKMTAFVTFFNGFAAKKWRLAPFLVIFLRRR
jgi:hypothetical protein